MIVVMLGAAFTLFRDGATAQMAVPVITLILCVLVAKSSR